MIMHIKRKNNSKVHMERGILSIESKEIPGRTHWQMLEFLSANFFNCECVLRDFFASFRRFWKPLQRIGLGWHGRIHLHCGFGRDEDFMMEMANGDFCPAWGYVVRGGFNRWVDSELPGWSHKGRATSHDYFCILCYAIPRRPNCNGWISAELGWTRNLNY